ncbi:Vegetative incompatibility protein HET-E-1-like protein 15 [Colletotrichum sojae]|uniref:Vegetative incompatibility protein HET-E-1-like protein 15 n=1 Tax=Colletotrichum sojae TaxID=2175907 RepID=A0A8H6ILX2_9PEZI|nr:Vegetative incompatibility protein HET-E-1-like protein 15 [Colletotrichum sojae]
MLTFCAVKGTACVIYPPSSPRRPPPWRTQPSGDGLTNKPPTWLWRKDSQSDGPQNSCPHELAGHATSRSEFPGQEFHGQGVQNSGSFHVGSSLNIDVHNRSDQYSRFLADLRSTDPRDNKSRIERIKGGLLRDSYR